VVFASFMQLVEVSTVNFQTFSELAFKFSLTPGITVRAFFFAMVMASRGRSAAVRAAHMNIVEALRSK
jgi:hypothetical protein